MTTMPDGGTLALDLSGAGMSNDSAIGWAYGLLQWPQPKSGHWILPKMGVRGHRYAAFVDVFNDAMELWKPGNVYIENPLPPQAQTDADTNRKIYALVGFVEEGCARLDIKFSGESCNTMRNNVIGRHIWPDGKTKPHIVRFVRDVLKLNVLDHNECDAIICWHDYRQKMLQIPPARHTLFRYGMAE